MDSKKLARLCWEYADNRKAEDIAILDVRELSSVADYFVICSGTSERQCRRPTNARGCARDDDHVVLHPRSPSCRDPLSDGRAELESRVVWRARLLPSRDVHWGS